jgi:GntR family transcriptional repressor for pyruvate dehydrogenase complex
MIDARSSDIAVLFNAVKAPRAFEAVIGQIEEAIVDGRLRVGDRLPSERELADVFDVSRPSLREALRVLEAFGVLRARRGRGVDGGSVITGTNQNGLASILRVYSALLEIPLMDLVEVREAIDMLAARSAAAKASDEQIGELRQVVVGMEATVDREAFHEFDTEFHLVLARISGNVVAPLLMEAFRVTIARAMKKGFALVDDWERERTRLIKEHVEIVDLLSKGDADAAATAVSRHIRSFYERVLVDGHEQGTEGSAKR